MDQYIVEILGVRKKVDSLLDMANMIEEGLYPRSIDSVKAALELNDYEVSFAVGISTKTIGRLRAQPKKRLKVIVGDRLFRAARLFAFATSVFGDKELAREWLRSPQIGLKNRIALKLMNTEAGALEVEDLLGRIEYGVLS